MDRAKSDEASDGVLSDTSRAREAFKYVLALAVLLITWKFFSWLKVHFTIQIHRAAEVDRSSDRCSFKRCHKQQGRRG